MAGPPILCGPGVRTRGWGTRRALGFGLSLYGIAKRAPGTSIDAVNDGRLRVPDVPADPSLGRLVGRSDPIVGPRAGRR